VARLACGTTKRKNASRQRLKEKFTSDFTAGAEQERVLLEEQSSLNVSLQKEVVRNDRLTIAVDHLRDANVELIHKSTNLRKFAKSLGIRKELVNGTGNVSSNTSSIASSNTSSDTSSNTSAHLLTSKKRKSHHKSKSHHHKSKRSSHKTRGNATVNASEELTGNASQELTSNSSQEPTVGA